MKNKWILLSLTLVCFVLTRNPACAQITSKTDWQLNKNSIYGGLGICGLCASLTGYYERILTQDFLDLTIANRKSQDSIATPGRQLGYAPFLRAGFGYQSNIDDQLYYALPQLGIVLGAKKHHLEIAAGPMFYQSHYGDEYTPVSGSLGYRFQKPQGNFQFRLGAAWPEGIISSTLGVAF